VIVGYEAMARVGMAMDVASNRRRGWHTTGVIGTFGSAAAAAHLLGLDERRTLFALGMAGTQSSGLWAFLADGATCKKLHTARAAVNGITAAILSKAGMSGPEHILDAEDGGLFAAVSDKYDMSVICSGLGETYEITKIDKKPYPCCRSTHPVIDAALMIRKEKEFLRDRIMDIQVETYEIAVLQCGGRYPQNTVEAKFSIAYTCAVAFIYGKVTLSEFSPRILEDPAVMRIADRVKVVGCRSFTERYPRQWGCRVAVTMKNGDVITRQIDDMSGSVQVPLTEDQEKDKFTASASSAYNDPLRVRRCMEDILHLDSLDRLPDLA
jgi:2-methylcitrate dehydratase PrpD